MPTLTPSDVSMPLRLVVDSVRWVRNSAGPAVRYGCKWPYGYASLVNNGSRSRSTSKLTPVTPMEYGEIPPDPEKLPLPGMVKVTGIVWASILGEKWNTSMPNPYQGSGSNQYPRRPPTVPDVLKWTPDRVSPKKLLVMVASWFIVKEAPP